MHLLLEVLYKEKKKVEEKIESAKKSPELSSQSVYEKYLEELNSDISRLEQTKDRPGLQTFSELIYVDDIRLRVNKIREGNGI